MKTDNKVRIQLERHLWPDEIEERKHKKRSTFILIFSGIAVFLFGLVLGGYFLSDQTGAINSEPSLSSKLDSVYSILQKKWYYGALDEDIEEHLIDRAIYGMANTEDDPHTYYMNSEELMDFVSSVDMEFVGIGVQYTTADNLNMITRVFHDSPASKAGVMSGDIFYSVDGELVSEMEAGSLPDKVKGLEGTDVVVEFIRDNEIIELTITRAPISYTAYGEMVSDDIGYLEIYSFGSTTGSEVKNYLNSMVASGMTKLIIDVRDNGGGYLDSFVDIVSNFVEEGQAVILQESADGHITSSNAKGGKINEIKDIVVLVNENSASASEVLTIALMELFENTTVIGKTTYGKGSVQVTQAFADGSALKYTTSMWTSPSGVWIEKVGITPDIEVSLPAVLYYSYEKMEDQTFAYDSVSTYVEIAQQALEFLGYKVTRTDGYFDRTTETELIKFQNEFDLANKGIIDNDTFETLISQVTKEWSLNDKTDTQLQKAIEVLSNK